MRRFWIVALLSVIAVYFLVWRGANSDKPTDVAQTKGSSTAVTAVATSPTIKPDRPVGTQVDSVGASNPKSSVSEPMLQPLPLGIQQDIQRLGPKDNSRLTVTAVSNNAVMIRLNKNHNVVPVAIVNDDGSVTVQEY